MTTARRIVLAFAVAALLPLGGCDNKCPTATPKIDAGGVPTCTGANAVLAGATVSVKLHVCPRCDQAYDTCTVTLPDAVDPVRIQLDPLVQVCTESTSCPAPSCSVVSCTFQAPTTVAPYKLLVVTPEGASIESGFEVSPSSSNTSCGG